MTTRINSFQLADNNLSAGENTTFTVVFDKAVVGLTVDDFLLTGAVLTNFVSTDGGVTFTGTITANDAFNGQGIIKLVAGSYFNGQDFTRGNADQLPFNVDTTAPLTPTISIENPGTDGVYNSEEVGQDSTVTATITLPTSTNELETTKPGDTLTVDGVDYLITQDMIDNGFDVEVTPGLDVTQITASITDAAGNTGNTATQPVAPAVTIVPDADAIFLSHLGANLSDSQGPSDHRGKTGGEYGTDINYETGTLNDTVYIGYGGFDSDGNLIVSGLDGDFERDSEDGNAVWTLETYAGDDLVHIREDQNAFTVAKLGSGDDTYYVQGEMDSVLGLAQTNPEARSFIYTESGNDTVVIGGNGDGMVTGWGIDGGRIFTGSGSDDVTVYGEMDDGGVIDLGAGRTEFANRDDAAAAITQDSAGDVNTLTISKNLGNAGLYDFGHVFGGAGDDSVTVGTFVEGTSVIDLGEGTNTVTIGDDLDGQAQVITGSGNDTLIIGDDTEDYSSINLGDGNNSISIASTVEDHSVIKTGNGDDTLDVGYAITNYANVNLGDGNNTINVADDIDGYSRVRTGNGDDVLNIGDDTEDGAVVDLGDGNNTITIASNVEDRSSIRVGSGNDTINVATSMLNSSEIRLGEGNNTLTLGESIIGATKITAGAGDDVLEVGYAIDGTAMINLGAGNNTITTGDDVDGYTKLTTGSGNDTLTIGDDTEDYAVINLGDGDNVINVADSLEDHSSIVTGTGNDTLIIGGSTWNSATAELGAGDDVVTISGNMYGASNINLGAGDDVISVAGKTLTGSIDGGTGQDTLVLDYTQDSSAVTANIHVTNATTNNITGIEVIELAGQNALEVRFDDLFQDTDRDGALFIQGDSSSKVDLGSTNWNSDDADKAQMRDTTGGNWAKTDSATVDGVSYDLYHNSIASNAANDVYIEQGIVVI